MPTELKPCPICGYEAISELTTSEGRSVYCARCFTEVERSKATGKYETLENARMEKQKREIEVWWNRRADNG